MNSTLAFFLDLLLVVLLVATIVHAVSLKRSLASLRDGKEELGSLLQGLAEAVGKAEVSISGMKAMAGEYDASLSQRIGTARALIDELQLINETADKLASRIERAVQNARPLDRPAAAPAVATADALRGSPAPSRPPAAQPRIAAVVPAKARPASAPVAAAQPAAAPQVVSANAAPSKPGPTKPNAGRSNLGSVERELLEAIDLLRRVG